MITYPLRTFIHRVLQRLVHDLLHRPELHGRLQDDAARQLHRLPRRHRPQGFQHGLCTGKVQFHYRSVAAVCRQLCHQVRILVLGHRLVLCSLLELCACQHVVQTADCIHVNSPLERLPYTALLLTDIPYLCLYLPATTPASSSATPANWSLSRPTARTRALATETSPAPCSPTIPLPVSSLDNTLLLSCGHVLERECPLRAPMQDILGTCACALTYRCGS
jgi:hypothetical protein